MLLARADEGDGTGQLGTKGNCSIRSVSMRLCLDDHGVRT